MHAIGVLKQKFQIVLSCSLELALSVSIRKYKSLLSSLYALITNPVYTHHCWVYTHDSLII